MASQAATSLREAVMQKLNELSAALEGVDEESAQERPAEGEWSCRDVMSHLMGEEEQSVTARMRRFVEEDEPLIPIERGVSFMTPGREAMSFSEMRQDVWHQYTEMADWVGGLTDEQLARKANVPLLKETPIGEYPALSQWVVALLNYHLADHISQVRTARQ